MLLNSYRFGSAVYPGLETYSTGLKAVRSLKRKYTGYTGACLRVRRSSDNTELDIGFLTLLVDSLLDTAALLTFAGAGSAFVTKIYEQSGTNDHWEQATNAKQPRIVNAGVYDGFVRFDGTTQSMSSVSNSGVATIYNAAVKINLRTGGTSGRIIMDRGVSLGGNANNETSISTGAVSGSGYINIYKSQGTDYMGAAFAIGTKAPNGVNCNWATMSYPTSGAPGCEWWRGATKYTNDSTTSTGTVTTGISGTASKYYLGARNNSAFWSDIDWYADAIYEGAIADADKVAIQAILDR